MAKLVRPCRVRQQPPEVRCWILDGPARALRFVVRERHREIRGKPQDHVFELSEPRDEGAGLVGELGVFALVVGVASGECSQVVVADLLQRGFVEAVGATITGLVGGAVGFQQGVGHRLRPIVCRPGRHRRSTADRAADELRTSGDPSAGRSPSASHPNYPDMVPIIEEVTAAWLRLLRRAGGKSRHPPPRPGGLPARIALRGGASDSTVWMTGHRPAPPRRPPIRRTQVDHQQPQYTNLFNPAG